MLIQLGWIMIIFTSVSYITDHRNSYILTFIFSYISVIYVSVYMWYIEQSVVQAGFAFILSLYSLYLVHLVIKKDFKPRKICKMVTITCTFLLSLYSINFVSEFMIQNVVNETNKILNFIGYNSTVVYENSGYYIVFEESSLRTEIVLACTGVGSISIFVGLVSSIENISLSEKIGLITLISGSIYILNTVRNVFIAASYGGQHFHIFPNLVEYIFGKGGSWVSYYVADKIISQFLASIVLFYITLLIFRSVGKKSKIESEIVDVIHNTVKHL